MSEPLRRFRRPEVGGEASVRLREAGLKPRPHGTSVSNISRFDKEREVDPRPPNERNHYGPTDTQVQEISDMITQRSPYGQSETRDFYGPEVPARPFNVDDYLENSRRYRGFKRPR